MLPLSESRLPLFGREAELGLLTGLLDAVQRSGAALVLRGEPGIGKSRLLAEAMSLAGQRNMSVLATTGQYSPRPGSRSPACSNCCVRARSHAAGLSPAHRSVLDAALGIGDEHPPEHFRIALAVLDLLSEAAARRPLLLIAEDAHWLDQPSVDVLSFVARRLESKPIVLLAAARDGYPAVFRDGELPELRLRPLDPASSARLLEQSTDTLSSAERGQVLREAAGNPLALVELPSIARRLEDEHSMPGLVPLTERMERAFAARAADLPPPCAGTWHTTLAPLPHLFRVLWPFWFLRGHPEEGRVRQRVEQLLPIASSLGRQAEEELLWTAGASATDLGDDQAAQAVRQRLEPLLPEIRDPFLSAVADLFMAWSTPITGDLEQALHEASACLDKLRGQDEPFFTSVAEFTASTIETALGRYDQALRHLGASRALADESGISWLVAGTRVQQGILQVLQVLQGKPDEARPVLAEALNLSLAARSTPWTALSLAGHARLALATGDARRAARLAGAAQGLRRRFGLQAWPMLRRSEADLVAQVRRALGGEQFDQAFADGSALSQQEAVAAAGADPTAAVLPATGNRPGPAFHRTRKPARRNAPRRGPARGRQDGRRSDSTSGARSGCRTRGAGAPAPGRRARPPSTPAGGAPPPVPGPRPSAGRRRGAAARSKAGPPAGRPVRAA